MRPTIIRLIVGGALGIAFSVSLMLPGAIVFPQDPPIRHLASPDMPSSTVVRAAAITDPKKAPSRRRVVVRQVYVPMLRTVRSASVVRHVPSPSTPPTTPVGRTRPPAQERLTPLSAPPAERQKAKKPKKAKRRRWEKEERPDESRKRDRDSRDEGDDDEHHEGEGGDGDRGDESADG